MDRSDDKIKGNLPFTKLMIQRYDIMLQKSAMKEIVWSKFPIYKMEEGLKI